MDSKLTKLILGLFLLYLCVVNRFSVAQAYRCDVIRQCKIDDTISQTLLFTRYYSDQNLLIKEVEHNSLDSTNPTVRIYQYNQAQRLIRTIDSTRFYTTDTLYQYSKNRLEEKTIVSSFLSTEAISPKTHDPIADSTSANQQPRINYVKIIDTSTQHYYYNKEGLVEKMVSSPKNDFGKRTIYYEYDKLNRLTQTTCSDQYRYRYYYNDKGVMVKKEKLENRYIDDSSIGRYFKLEEERLKKANWQLASTYEMVYDSKGNLVELTQLNSIGYPGKIILRYGYDEKNRLLGSAIIEGNTTDEDYCWIKYIY